MAARRTAGPIPAFASVIVWAGVCRALQAEAQVAHFAKTGQRFRQLKDSSFAKSRTAWRRWFSVA
jgi:hypothetical protein